MRSEALYWCIRKRNVMHIAYLSGHSLLIWLEKIETEICSEDGRQIIKENNPSPWSKTNT